MIRHLALLLACLWALGPAAAHTPHDEVQVLAVSPTFEVDGTLFATMNMSEHRVFTRSTDGGRSWQSFGHMMVQEKVESLALSPAFADDGVAFLGSNGAGLWRTADGGSNWRRVTGGFTADTVFEIVFAPDYAESGVVAVATDDGFWVSTNGGFVWTQQNAGLSESSLLVMTAHAGGPQGVVFYAGSQRLHRSDDLGVSWTVLGDFDGVAQDLRLHPDFPTTPVIGAVLRADGGIAFSTDGGLSFPPALATLVGEFVTDLRFRSDDSLLASSSEFVLRAPDLNGAWTPQPKQGLDALSDQTNLHYRQLLIAPLPEGAGETIFLAGFEGIFESRDDAQSWERLDVYPQRVNRTITISPNYPKDHTLLLGNFGGGLVLSEDGGKHWESAATPGAGAPLGGGGVLGGPGSGAAGSVAPRRGGGAAVPAAPAPHAGGATQWRTEGADIYSLWTGPLAVSPTYAQDRTIMIGHASLWVSNDRGRNWFEADYPSDINVIRGVTMSPVFADDGVAFFGTSDFGAGAEFKGVWKTTDGGHTWNEASDGIANTAKVREFVFSSGWVHDQTVFMASRVEGVWRTQDGGANWVEVSDGLTHPMLRVIRLSPNYPTDGTLWVGSVGGGLFMSTDRGETWEPRNAGIPDLAGIDIEGIAVSPNYRLDGTLFVSTQRAGVWKSTDRAQTWQPVNDGLPLDMPRGLEISPGFADDNTLFLSTHDWVWRSTDAGLNWTRLGGRIRVPDDHPAVRYDTMWQREVLAGSHGLGVSASVSVDGWSELEFRGDQVRWYATLEPTGGIARVLVDGEQVALVDTYAAQPTAQVLVFERNFGGTVDWHTIRVEVTGTANPAASGDRLNSDGFEYRF